MAASRRLQVQRWPPTPVPTSSSELNRKRTAKIARLEQNERNRVPSFLMPVVEATSAVG